MGANEKLDAALHPNPRVDLNKTEFAVIMGLVRENWDFRHEPVEGKRKIEAVKGPDHLFIEIVGMKTEAVMNGVKITQKRLPSVIEGKPWRPTVKPQ